MVVGQSSKKMSIALWRLNTQSVSVLLFSIFVLKNEQRFKAVSFSGAGVIL